MCFWQSTFKNVSCIAAGSQLTYITASFYDIDLFVLSLSSESTTLRDQARVKFLANYFFLFRFDFFFLTLAQYQSKRRPI